MASLNMEGSYDFTNDEIDEQVTKTSAGNYALGFVRKDGFVPKYVGRSDDDLNRRLKEQKEEYGSKYAKFMYSYAGSPKAAFDKECRNYHDFEEQLDNKIHPARPSNSNWKCKYCNNLN